MHCAPMRVCLPMHAPFASSSRAKPANLPTLEDRRAWLADFGARHGSAAVERLRGLVRQVWREREVAA